MYTSNGMAKLWKTSGSIVEPAGRCAVVGLKPTVGLTSRAGLIPCNEFQDTVGTLTRGVLDAAHVLDLISGQLRDDSMLMDVLTC